jgi:hypothetical protein
MLVRGVGKSDCGPHEELDAEFLYMLLKVQIVLHTQKGQPVVSRVCARIRHDRTPLQVTYQL